MLTSPRWMASQLGLPIPDSPHAVSACLPLWAHNIAYEEGDEAVIGRLQAAYPRFCLHPLVRELWQRVIRTSPTPEGSEGLLFPSRRTAERALDYVRSRGGRSGRLVPVERQSIFGVSVAPEDFPRLREYWQHAGELISSRMAEQVLAGETITFAESDQRRFVRQRVAACGRVSGEDVWLYTSGMAAAAAVWRAIRQSEPAAPTVQFGFPYVDTLKLQQRFSPANCLFLPQGSTAELDRLAAHLQESRIAAVFCETPANPLLTCCDLHRLRELADRHGFVLVVDDTLSACLNLDVLPLADVVMTSLTKYFSGRGDVLAGSVTLNPRSPQAQRLRAAISGEFEELLSDRDTEVLERNSRDMESRVSLINHNAVVLANRLANHPLVDRVWHPSLRPETAYERLRCREGGYGGLMSLVLRHPDATTPRVFDALEVCKGPNLGTIFTLCCPYTILAHYQELDFAESCGVSRWLLRVSVGTEPIDELWQRFQRALQQCHHSSEPTANGPSASESASAHRISTETQSRN